MGLIQKLGTGTGYLKAGFLGFPKSGKTYTATLLACGIKEYFKLEGPIVLFDTEGGGEYIATIMRRLGAGELLGVRARAFDDLMKSARESEEIGAAVFLVDSITHPWRELCDAHLKGINDVLRARGRAPRTRLEFQDWAAIKNKWAPWTDWYLNSPMHVIICGRAGFEWDFEEREDGRKDLVKRGMKMKTESEFGFEPSLLVEMERVQKINDKTEIIHRATVIGDRFAVIDGAQADNPRFEFFLPHIACLVPGAVAPVDTAIKTDAGITDEEDTAWQRERQERAILCEEIQGELLRVWPGQTTQDKKAKVEAVEAAFGTRSWTKVESFNSEELRKGLAKIREIVAAVPDR